MLLLEADQCFVFPDAAALFNTLCLSSPFLNTDPPNHDPPTTFQRLHIHLSEFFFNDKLLFYLFELAQ